MTEPSFSRALSRAVSFTVKKYQFLRSGQMQFICYFFLQIPMFYGREGVCFSHNCTCQENDSEQRSLQSRPALCLPLFGTLKLCASESRPFIGTSVHTDARDLGLSRCQILTASQDKAHWCVGSVLVNIKSGEAASVSVLQNQFLWDVAVTHRQPQQSNGWGSRITSSRPAWAPSFKPDFKCRWGPVSKTPKQASNSFDLQTPESTSGFWATR